MVYFLKRSGKSADIGSFKTSRDTSLDEEHQLMKKVDAGTVTDADIAKITKNGGEALRFMERRADKLRKDLAHVDRLYGKGTFDGISDDGSYFKEMDGGSVAKPEYSEKAAEAIKPLLQADGKSAN